MQPVELLAEYWFVLALEHSLLEERALLYLASQYYKGNGWPYTSVGPGSSPGLISWHACKGIC